MPYPDFTTDEIASETWKQVNTFPNYSVSNIGRVRNDVTGLILRQRLDCWGYIRTTLCHNTRRMNWMTHRMVAIAFIGPPPYKKAEINHLNGVKIDNRPENLEWTNRSGNERHAYVTGLKRPAGYNGQPYGERSYCAKLTDNDVRCIRASTERLSVLGRQYGVNPSTIAKIKKRLKWKRVAQ